MIRPFILLMLFMAYFAVAHPVVAGESAEDAAEGTAKEAFDQGNELFLQGNYSEAAKAFRTAYQIKPTWKLWYNIGQAEVAATHLGAGLVAFENYLAKGGDLVPAERSEEVLSEIRRIRELVGSLEVIAEPGCVVRVNGEVRGTTPMSGLIKLAAGMDHKIAVEREGAILFERTVRLSGGDERTITVPKQEAAIAATPEAVAVQPPAPVVEEKTAEPVTVVPTNSEIAPAVPPAPTDSKKLKIGGIVLLTGGAVALAIGGVTGAAAFSKSGSLDEECPNNKCSETTAVDDMYTSQTLGTVSTLLFAVGGAMAITGAVLLIANKRKHTDKSDAATGISSNRIQFSGGMLKGRF